MIHDDDATADMAKRNLITPGEDLSAFSLDDLAERRLVLLDEIRRIDEITDKKKAGRDAADAVFNI
jgi:uncharacterized small protein (DUF1192 family)